MVQRIRDEVSDTDVDDRVEGHREAEIHDEPQPPDAHGNERHDENFTADTHDHTGGTDGSDTISPARVSTSEELAPPTVETRDDIPEDTVGFYYIEDEDEVTLRVEPAQ